MRRAGPAVLAVALLAATAAAFVRAEQLKLEPGPIVRPVVDDVVAPTCGCANRTAHVAFALRRAGTISVAVADADGDVVRTLVSHRRYGRRDVVSLSWDGRYEDGRLVPDGVYRPRLDLPRRAPLLMPNTIQVDTRAPRVRVTGTTRPVISPDADNRFDGFIVSYALDAPARGVLYVNGRRLSVKKRVRQADEFRWYGRLDGGPARAGTYTVAVGAVDDAGNGAPPTGTTRVRVRFVELARDTIRAKARTRFGVGVRSDVRRFRWRFAGRSGRGRPGLLVLRAPRPGRYALFVQANGHADRATVRVTAR